MKKIFGIIGIGLVAGAIAYVIWDKTKNVKKAESSVAPDKEEYSDAVTEKKVVNVAKEKAEAEEEFVVEKCVVADEITARHEEAAKIMKEAGDIICQRSEITEDENTELEQISDELDELLNEE